MTCAGRAARIRGMLLSLEWYALANADISQTAKSAFVRTAGSVLPHRLLWFLYPDTYCLPRPFAKRSYCGWLHRTRPGSVAPRKVTRSG